MTGEPRTDADPRRRLPAIPLWVALLLMVAALALAAVILTRVAEPLYGLVFSSGVPVPEGAVEVERVKPERGAAYRIYRTSQSGRDQSRPARSAWPHQSASGMLPKPPVAKSATPSPQGPVTTCRGAPRAISSAWVKRCAISCVIT